MSNAIHLGEISSLPDKTKCDVIARVVTNDMKTSKAGKTYFNSKLDGVNTPVTVYLSNFGNSLHDWVGRTVVLKGVEKGSYNDKPQLMMGKFGKVEEWAADFEAAPRPAPKPIQTAPAPQTARNVAQNSPNGTPVHGATVGGALARAVDLWLNYNAGTVWSLDSIRAIESITRDLVAIQQRVESGATEEKEDVPF